MHEVRLCANIMIASCTTPYLRLRLTLYDRKIGTVGKIIMQVSNESLMADRDAAQ